MGGLVSSSGIRGVAMEEVTPSLLMRIGIALGSERKGCQIVGHDVRSSSPLLARALACGINASGSDVQFLGLAPTPAVAFYSRKKRGGAMVTASHNPPKYNGVKIFDENGASIAEDRYSALIERSRDSSRVAPWNSPGSTLRGAGLYDYIASTASAARLGKKWRVGLDLGNGASVVTAPVALAEAGCSVTAINIAPDGAFPGRGAEPSEEALSQLSGVVRSKGLDIGFAFDGDGDRLSVVDERGVFIPQDSLLAFVASTMVRRAGAGKVVVNVDTSAAVDIAVEEAGGAVVRTKVGDPHILRSMLDAGAVFGGETCGAWIFPAHSLCPDGLLSSIVLMGLIEEEGLAPSDIAARVPRLSLTRLKIRCEPALKGKVLEGIVPMASGAFKGSSIEATDGIRISMGDKSWVLIRPSGTEPLIRITAEARDRRSSEDLARRASAMVESLVGGSK
ncbi:MAG: phosphoglucosamine mutase [Candidatus Methanomethylicia archaeon]|nr:phosphoglucosamine mutase [Candidatus Methanomethylicia archaeon]